MNRAAFFTSMTTAAILAFVFISLTSSGARHPAATSDSAAVATDFQIDERGHKPASPVYSMSEVQEPYDGTGRDKFVINNNGTIF